MLIDAPSLAMTAPVALLANAWQPLAGLLTRVTSGPQRRCVACGNPVLEQDPHVRYRGEYYHAEPCLENDPPALRRHQLTLSPVNP